MKKLLLLSLFLFSATAMMAQCSDLFISEYVEGYANNKALEIYNPTSQPINLSGYSIARFRNGATTSAPTTSTPAEIVQLPDVMLDPDDVYVVVIDKQDTTLWDSQFDKPVWNGYNLIDTLFDQVTEEPITDSLGNVILGPQYTDEGSALFGSEYNEEYDLQCKADMFLCPDYNTNRAMYFNGNDAVALITGTAIASDGGNLVDVIGVIGEDPEQTIMEDAWVNADGFWLTKNRTLIRKPEIAGGRNDLNDVLFGQGGTFDGEEWTSTWNNSFQYLGIHNSDCGVSKPDEFSCSFGVSAYEVNEIPFNMYPNPLSYGSLTIEAAENMERVEIYTLTGQLAYTQNVGLSTEKVEVNLDAMHAGMYLVNIVFDENKISIQKLIVE